MSTARYEFLREVPYLTPLQLRERVRNTNEEEQRFEEYCGAARFHRIRNIVLADSIASTELALEAARRPNVVIIPGIMH